MTFPSIGLQRYHKLVVLIDQRYQESANKYLRNISEGEKTKLDIVSICLSTIGFGLVLYGFSNAGSHGWSDGVVIATIVIGILITAIFCIRQIKLDNPLLNLFVFKNRTFTLTSLINVFITMIMYADMILLPIYLQDGREFSAFDAGLLLLPGALINALLSPVTGRLFDRFGAKPLFFTGMIFIIPSMWVLTDLSESTSFLFIMIRTIFLRIGFSFITMPLNTAGLNALPRHLVTHGTAVNNTVRQISGAIGTAIVVTIFTAQTNSHLGHLMSETPTSTVELIGKLASILGASDAYL